MGVRTIFLVRRGLQIDDGIQHQAIAGRIGPAHLHAVLQGGKGRIQGRCFAKLAVHRRRDAGEGVVGPDPLVAHVGLEAVRPLLIQADGERILDRVGLGEMRRGRIEDRCK